MNKQYLSRGAFGVCLALSLASCGGGSPEAPKEVKAIDVKNMDLSVDPRVDFNMYANGGWKANHPIPAEKGRYGAFDVLRDESDEQVKTLIQSLAKKGGEKGSLSQKVGTFYSLGTNLELREEQGIKPLASRFAAIQNIKTQSDVQDMLAAFHYEGVGAGFAFYVMPDAKNSTWNIGNIFQSGLGLPDRDYYLADDERSKELRTAYVDHVEKMFVLFGEDAKTAKTTSEQVMKFETRLASASMTRLEERDPIATYNKMDLAGLEKLAPELDWKRYFSATKISNTSEINVAQTKFVAEVANMTKTVSVEDWKAYFRWSLLNTTSGYLTKDFVAQNFAFYGKELSGQEEMRPLWKRVQGVVSGSLSEAIGQLYVEKYFPPAAKERMVKLVQNLRVALGQRIEQLEWMTDPTKAKAAEKLATINVKIGYPDKWKDYTPLVIEEDSYVANVLRAMKFSIEQNRKKLAKEVDKTEWGMSPQTVNAYYSPLANEIVFPAAILQPPFFYMNGDDAVNYGAIGVVIGHEMTHGFDDQGCKYNKEGNLSNWWTDVDAKQFEERTQILVEQFNNLTVYDSIPADGELTLGENIADLGGLNISYQAFKNTQPGTEKIDNFTPEQRFYLAYANVWAQNVRKKEMLRLTKEDVHSLGHNRILGPLPNIPAFHEAFGVKEGDPMYLPKEKRAIIW